MQCFEARVKWRATILFKEPIRILLFTSEGPVCPPIRASTTEDLVTKVHEVAVSPRCVLFYRTGYAVL